MEAKELLEKIYNDAKNIDIGNIKLSAKVKKDIDNIVAFEESAKGVFTCVVASFTYKILNPKQDVRYHKIDLPNGYSGRSFDTKFVTPFLKSKGFAGAMKESGWLTRSIEQDAPFTKDFPGKIQKDEVKTSFLDLLDYTYTNPKNIYDCLLYLFAISIKANETRKILVVNPIKSESDITITSIIEKLKTHFYYKYKERGASILPVIAIYSIYECLISELKRFSNMYLDDLASHYSCDKSSRAIGDIVVRKKTDNTIYEVVEIKFDIPINAVMIKDAYKKISKTNIQRYYVLSTIDIPIENMIEIAETIFDIREQHGCQIIANGVFGTLKYYLRLLENTDVFIEKYVNNLQKNKELKLEHKSAWNIINERMENDK